MMRRFNARRETRAAVARSRDALWASAAAAGVPPCEVGETEDERYPEDTAGLREEVDTIQLTGWDPLCPFQAGNELELALHICTTNTGQMVRLGQDCFPGARRRMQDEQEASKRRHPSFLAGEA
jgi:hypothetical protein